MLSLGTASGSIYDVGEITVKLDELQGGVTITVASTNMATNGFYSKPRQHTWITGWQVKRRNENGTKTAVL